MANMPGPIDYSKARIYHWLHNTAENYNSGILESTKNPLESRVWRAYEGQLETWGHTKTEGTQSQPSRIARKLDDGTTQLYQYSRNRKGKVCESVDPVGRTTRYTYGAFNPSGAPIPDIPCTAGSSIDIIMVEQKNGLGWDLVRSATYNAKHQPLTVTDAALQTTTYTYLADGRLETVVTPPRNGHVCNPTCGALTPAERTTTYVYYPVTDPLARRNRLKTVTGPSVDGTPGPSTTFTYDDKGRVETTTDSELYVLAMEYDNLDRRTKITYPDDTFEQTTYNRLDAEGHRDRLGRWSYAYHNELRQVYQTKDPLLRITEFTWCSCGSLEKVTDPEGNETKWNRDLLGRVTKETRDDDKFWEYAYELKTSRLRSVTDPKLQVKTYSYDLDDKLIGIAYTNELPSTPDVTYSYRNLPTETDEPDPHGRLRTVTDGTGTTIHYYHPAGTLGALRLASVDGPILGTGDLLEYAYDELGRIKNRKLGGTANEVSYRFDSLGRLRTQIALPGNFTVWIRRSNGPSGEPSIPERTAAGRLFLLSELRGPPPTGNPQQAFRWRYHPLEV